MTRQLNIKALAKGMRVEDKAKLLFADRDKRAETSGREGILSPDEERVLIEDAQDLHQIRELNRLNRLYNMAVFMGFDIQTAYLNFRLAEGRLVTILTAIILVGEANDVLSHAIYDLSSQVYTDKQLEDKKFQDEVGKKAGELRKKYKGKGLSDIYDYFEPSLRDGSHSSTESEIASQPNPHLQRVFMQTVREVKVFKKRVYQREYIETKAGMELMSDKDKVKIDSFTNEINEFVSLESYLGLIKIYADFADKGMLRTTDLEEPEFLEAVGDMEKATSLSEKEKTNAQIEIDGVETKQLLS